jgi:hypothetical protein
VRRITSQCFSSSPRAIILLFWGRRRRQLHLTAPHSTSQHLAGLIRSSHRSTNHAVVLAARRLGSLSNQRPGCCISQTVDHSSATSCSLGSHPTEQPSGESARSAKALVRESIPIRADAAGLNEWNGCKMSSAHIGPDVTAIHGVPLYLNLMIGLNSMDPLTIRCPTEPDIVIYRGPMGRTHRSFHSMATQLLKPCVITKQ